MIFPLLSSLFWGLNGLFVRKGLLTVRPIPGTFLTLLTGFPILLAWAIASGELSKFGSIDVTTLSYLALIGLFQYILGRIPVFTSISIIGASRAYTLSATGIPLGVLLSALLLNEKLTTGMAIGVSLNFIGISVITMSQSSKMEAFSHRSFARGVSLALLGGLSYGIMGALTRAGVLRTEAPILANLVAAMNGILMYILVLFATHQYPYLKSIDRPSLSNLALSGILTTLALISFFLAASFLQASVVVSIAYTYPLFTAVFSVLFLQRLELVNLRVVLGALAVMVGTYFVAS